VVSALTRAGVERPRIHRSPVEDRRTTDVERPLIDWRPRRTGVGEITRSIGGSLGRLLFGARIATCAIVRRRATALGGARISDGFGRSSREEAPAGVVVVTGDDEEAASEQDAEAREKW
jgi:hypothetical protein